MVKPGFLKITGRCAAWRRPGNGARFAMKVGITKALPVGHLLPKQKSRRFLMPRVITVHDGRANGADGANQANSR